MALLRARSSVVVTGRGTAVSDRPSLTVRPGQWQGGSYPAEEVRQPLRAVIDAHLAVPPDTPLITAEGRALVFGLDGADAERRARLESAGAEVALVPAQGDHVALPAVLDELARRECNEVLFECGAELGGALMRAGLVDELWLYLATTLLGSSARPLVALPGIEQMSDQIRLKRRDLRVLGEDLRLVLEPAGSD